MIFPLFWPQLGLLKHDSSFADGQTTIPRLNAQTTACARPWHATHSRSSASTTNDQRRLITASE